MRASVAWGVRARPGRVLAAGDDDVGRRAALRPGVLPHAGEDAAERSLDPIGQVGHEHPQERVRRTSPAAEGKPALRDAPRQLGPEQTGRRAADLRFVLGHQALVDSPAGPLLDVSSARMVSLRIVVAVAFGEHAAGERCGVVHVDAESSRNDRPAGSQPSFAGMAKSQSRVWRRRCVPG
jgi:hypothetical protein